MTDRTSNEARDRAVEELVLKGIVQRASLLSFMFSFAFPIYGITSLLFIEKFDSTVTVWNNTYPRIIFNGIPFLCLSLFLKKARSRAKLKSWTWAIAWPLIFYAATWIRVLPIMIAGQTEIYLYVHAANIIVFALCFMVVAQTPVQILASFLTLAVTIHATSVYVFRQAGDQLIARYYVNEMTLYSAMLLLCGYVSFKLRRALAEHEVWQAEQIASRDLEIQRKTKEALDLEVSARVGKLATQIAHDMKSPMAALNAVRKLRSGADAWSKDGDEGEVVAQHAMDRLTEIADTLLDREKLKRALGDNGVAGDSGMRVAELDSVVALLVKEKQAEYRAKAHLSITYTPVVAGEESLATTFAAEPKELRVILSNLINNSVEACEKEGRVAVELIVTEHTATIQVVDNGKGIDPSLVTLLGNRGATFGKLKGLGLGLYHAKTQVEGWGGTMNITSQLDGGTRCSITLVLPGGMSRSRRSDG